MPKPNKGENKDDYISRFMSDKDMKEKYPEEEQRLKIAFIEWEKDVPVKKSHKEENFKKVYELDKADPDNIYKFEGTATEYGTLDKTGEIMEDGAFSDEIGKVVSIQVMHQGIMSIIGTGTLSKSGSKIFIKGDLFEGDPQADKIAKAKAAGVKFNLSIGGKRKDWDWKDGNLVTKKATINEVSFTGEDQQAHPSAIVTKTNELNKEEENMSLTLEEIKKAMQEVSEGMKKTDISLEDFSKMQEDVINLKKALENNNNEEIDNLKKTVEAMDKTINELSTPGMQKTDDFTDEEMFKAIGMAAADLQKVDTGVTIGEVLEKATASTTTHASGVKHAYLTRILERIQDQNPIMSDVNFMSITDNSLFIPREMIGYPETGWVGESDDRTDTTENNIDDVTISLYQLYAMPVVTNKLLGTNYVQYGQFLTMRTSQALDKAISDAILFGTGTGQPTGIFIDTTVAASLVATDLTDSDDVVDLVDQIREEYSSNGKWYMHRLTWNRIKKLQNAQGDYHLVDLADMTNKVLLGRPVILVDTIKDYDTALTGDPIVLFGDVSSGSMGIRNNNLTISIEDKVTKKGFTRFYSELGIGFSVTLPEAFTGFKKV